MKGKNEHLDLATFADSFFLASLCDFAQHPPVPSQKLQLPSFLLSCISHWVCFSNSEQICCNATVYFLFFIIPEMS